MEVVFIFSFKQAKMSTQFSFVAKILALPTLSSVQGRLLDIFIALSSPLSLPLTCLIVNHSEQ